MQATTFSFSLINDSRAQKVGGVAILIGGLLKPNPKFFMTRTISLFTESDAIKKEFYGTVVQRNNHYVFVEEHLDNPYLWLVAWGIERDELYTTTQINGLVYKQLVTANQNIIIVKGGFESDSPQTYMDAVVYAIVGNKMHNVFIESNLRNPYYRIIVFNINDLPQRKFTKCPAQ